MHSVEKFLSEEPSALRRRENADLNVNDRWELRHHARMIGVDEVRLLHAVEVAGSSLRAVHAQLGL